MPESGYGSGSVARSNESRSVSSRSDEDSSSSDNSTDSVKTSYTDTSTLAGIEALSREKSTEDRLRDAPSSLATTPSSTVNDTDNTTAETPALSPLAGPAAMVARREFNHVPLRSHDAFQAYKNLTADDFAGPDDMRLKQLKHVADDRNMGLKHALLDSFSDTTTTVSGRAKTPFSTYGKLQETPGSMVGDIKDLSGLRVDVDPVRPDFADVYHAQAVTKSTLGDGMTLKQDYIETPNRWGYTGRVHSTLTEPGGLTHEIQVGTRDISGFIDADVSNSAGQRISLHDATGYKGQIYGVDLPENLQSGYTDIIGDIKDLNGAGSSVVRSPQVQGDIASFRTKVEDALPSKIETPEPAISTRARVGNFAGQGMGVLGIAASGMQTVNGAQTLAEGGDTVLGVADIGAGTTGMVSGGALLTGRVALGTTTGGAVAIVDGAKDIYLGVRDGDVEKTAVGSVKAGAGTAMIAGVASANPVIIAGGAVVYTGAVIYESRDAIVGGAKKAAGWVKSWFD